MDKHTGKPGSGFFRAWTAAVMLLCLLFVMQPQKAQAATTIQGIDVSRWQGSINWSKVKKDGINFVMIGTGRFKNGVATQDPYFETNIQGANNVGINVGIYHYLTATTTSDAKAAANYVLSLANGHKVSYPIAVDIEDDVYKSMSKKKRTDLVIAFLDVIADAGYYPAVYASDDYFVSSLNTSRLKSKGYDFWVAAWTKKPVTTPLSMWQYSSTGKVSGISGTVDVDYSYKDYSSLVAPRYSPKKVEAGWYTDGTNTWYVKSNGSIPKSSFVKVGSRTYYVNAEGYRVTGWQTINGKRYFFKKSGVMRTGWYTSKGNKYYFDPDTGACASGKTTIGGKTYYFNKSTGVMQTGWVKRKGSYYYFSPSTGVMETGWTTISGRRYYLTPGTGAMATGWLTVKNKTYYIDESTGNPLTGLQKIENQYYYFSKGKGIMRTGWRQISGNWYYFKKSNGVMLRNTTYNGYVFDSDGICTNR